VWAIESVDFGVGPDNTSLELDIQGRPHVSYRVNTINDLRYATKSLGAWTIETVDAAGVVGTTSSLELDGQGNPSISYQDNTNGDLKYAARRGSAWTLEVV